MADRAAIYVRVSTADKSQDVAVQEEPLREWVGRLGLEPVVFREAGVSGATTARPVLDALVREVRRRRFQAVAVWRLDRLGRSLAHLLQLLQEIEAVGARLLVHDLAIDTGTPQGRLFFQMVGAFAEFERGLLAERTKDGMAHAKSQGTRSGRPIGRPRLSVDFLALAGAYQARRGEVGLITRLAEEFEVSRGWLQARRGELEAASGAEA